MAADSLREAIQKVDHLLASVDSELKSLHDRKSELIARRKSLTDELQDIDLAKIRKIDWSSKDFEWSSKMDAILRDTFHLERYRPLQLEAINAFLSGHDVMLVMPTGGGKSLCYQLPALVQANGFTLVISPLVSLIEDQVMALQQLKVNVITLNASSSRETVAQVHRAMTDPSSCELKLLYVTPEKVAKSKMFMNKLQKAYELGTFTRIAIDEVHCCSQWGHDFRPDYKYLSVLKQIFPKLPIIGLTATITSQVKEDVMKILNIGKCLHFKAHFNRPNLFYSVRQKPETMEEMVDQLHKLLTTQFVRQSGIIYTLTIKDSEQLSEQLCGKGIKAKSYHASLEGETRSKVHRLWLSGECQVVVATIAFGMGIDKPSVRFVIHHSMSKSMENFYQESGRAGRDDAPASCILFYRLSDISRLSTMVFVEQTGLSKLYEMVAYCLDMKRCRREIISQHFQEDWESRHCNAMCDHCKERKNSTFNLHIKDVTQYANAVLKILRVAEEKEQKVTSLKLLNALMNSGPLRLKDWKYSKADFNRAIGERTVASMLIQGHIKEDFHYTPYSTLSYLTNGPVPVTVPFSIQLLPSELP